MKMTKMINEFCAPFGVTARKGKEWLAYAEDLEIHFPKKKKKYNAPGFMACMRALYPDVNTSEFIWSILHEVGHCMTYWQFTPQKWEAMCKQGEEIRDIFEYCQLPHEKSANDWAADYIRNHPKRVKKWEKRFKNKIEKRG